MPYIESGDWTDYIDKGLSYGQQAVSTGQKVVTTAKQGKSVVEDALGIFKGSASAPPVAPTPIVRDQRIVRATPSPMYRPGGSLLGNLLTTRNLVLAGAAYLGYRLLRRR